jgi:hypothetical protein
VVSCKLHGRSLARSECAKQLFKMAHASMAPSHGPQTGFATYDEFKDYVSNAGVKFAELGASKGISRKALEDRLDVKNIVRPEPRCVRSRCGRRQTQAVQPGSTISLPVLCESRPTRRCAGTFGVRTAAGRYANARHS